MLVILNIEEGLLNECGNCQEVSVSSTSGTDAQERGSCKVAKTAADGRLMGRDATCFRSAFELFN